MTLTSKTITTSGPTRPIIFFGTESFSAHFLEALLAAKYPIVAAVTRPDSYSGRGHKLTPPVVKQVALRAHIPVWQPQKVSEINTQLRNLQPIAGVLVSYGKMIPQSTIGLFTPGIINVHPSLLPRYRGPTPVETSILSGDTTTGVSLMQIVAQMDAGGIYKQTTISLGPHETKLTLYQSLARAGTELLLQFLPAILDGRLQPRPQDESRASFSHLLHSADAWIDPTKLTAIEAERRVRAYLGFPKTKLSLFGHTVIITKAHAVAHPHTKTDITFKNHTYLAIDELITPNGKNTSAEAFSRGYLK